jgi:hypothetical protein
MFNGPKFFDTYFEKISIGMKRKYVFYGLTYWEDIKNGHLLYPMHILKNVSSSLWRNISWNKSDMLAIGRDIITSNTKKRHWPKNKTRGEVGPSCSFKEGDVPWILKKDYISMVKDVILGVKEAYSYGSTLQCCLTTKENLLGLKSNDHLNLIRVCMLNT